MKIILAEKVSPATVAVFKDEPSWTVLTADQVGTRLAEELNDADALIVRSAVKVTGDLLEHAQKLRVIGRAGIGVDNIELPAATRKGIAVMNTPGANAVAVAEQTIGMMLCLARHLPRANDTTKAGKWEKKSLEGTELRGKTLGVIGLGRIGLEVASRAQAFGMKVVGHDPYISTELARERKVELKTLEDLYPMVDYLSLHLALTPQTRGMINTESLAKMKKGVRIINCARGELINEAALAEALKSGVIGGAALDVFAPEPPKDSPLLGLENVMATPHIAGSTKEAQEAVGIQIAQQVKEYLARGVIQNAVNVPSVSYEEYVDMHPFIVLAERLGSFLAQAVDTEGNLNEIHLRYTGRLAGWKTQLIRNSGVMGVLNASGAEGTNLINANSIADSRGVKIREYTKDKPASGAGDVITITLKSEGSEHTISGTVLHGRLARLLSIEGIDIEAPLENDLLYLRNRDVPGVVGRVGTILGEHKVNIANFSLGRGENAAVATASGNGQASEPALAVAVVQVDGRVPEAVLADLKKIPAMTVARAVHL